MLQLAKNLYFSQLLDYEEDGEFHLISATAAFMKRDLKRIAGLWDCGAVLHNRWVQVALSNDQNHLRSSCTLENRTLSSSHVDASHVTQTKNGAWPGTGFEWQMVSTFSVRKIRLGILDYLSRNPVFPRKFPFGETKFIFPFTFHPKFPDFLGKW